MAEQLEAIIEETIFRNEENGYSVVQAKAGRESVTVVGALPAMAPGEQVSLSGGWVEHPQYGKQWKATACEIRQPTTLLGIERYLGSGLIKGVGPSTARLLVQEFGKRTLDVLSEQPERLTEVPGIGKKRAAQLALRLLRLADPDMPVKLAVEAANTRAQRLYRSLGFRQLPERDGDDLIFCMEENPDG